MSLNDIDALRATNWLTLGGEAEPPFLAIQPSTWGAVTGNRSVPEAFLSAWPVHRAAPSAVTVPTPPAP